MDQITNNLFQAIDILVAAQISKLKYDTTVTGEVIGISDDEPNKYDIQINETTIIQAYADNQASYISGTQVTVLVPENNYENKLIILGAYSGTQEEQYTYTNPLDQLIIYDKKTIEKSYDAQSIQTDLTKPWITYSYDNAIEDYISEKFLGFTTTIVSEQLDDNLIEENYGLIFIINDDRNFNIFNKIKANFPLNQREESQVYYLDNSYLLGDSYNYLDGFPVSFSIKLENFNNIKIKTIDVYRYNQCNNVFVDYIDPTISLCYPKDLIQSNSIILNADRDLTYKGQTNSAEELERRIDSKLIFKAPDKEVYSFYPPSILDENIIIKYRWYRYNETEEGDEIGGVNWEYLGDENNLSYLNITLNNQVKTDQIKLIAQYKITNAETEAEETAEDTWTFLAENSLTFKNLENALSEETASLIDLLEIKLLDDKYNGFYNLYGNDYKATLDNTFLPKLKVYYEKTFISWNEEQDRTKWYFPISSTMIKPVFSLYTLTSQYEPNKYYLKTTGIDSETGDSIDIYKISDSVFQDETLTYYEKYEVPEEIDEEGNTSYKTEYSVFNFDTPVGKYYKQSDKYVKITEKEQYLSNMQLYELNPEYFIVDAQYEEIDGYYVITTGKSEIGFSIKENYEALLSNNTVRCQVYKNINNPIIYNLQKTLYFGLGQTSGTNYSFSIKVLNQKSAALPCVEGTEGTSSITIKAFLTEKSNGAESLLSPNSVKWSWFSQTANISNRYSLNNIFEIPNNGIDTADNIVTIRRFNNKVDHFAILQADVEVNGITLTAYLPIGAYMKYDQNLFLNGATRIVYDNTGKNPSLDSTTPYQIYDSSNNKFNEEVQWRVYEPVIPKDSQVQEDKYYTLSKQFSWDKDNNILTMNDLFPSNIKALCLEGYYNKKKLNDEDIFISEEEAAIWYQPILIVQNAYAFNYINSWRGDKVEIGETHILASFLGAGKKNFDNSFTGVVLGTVEEEFGNQQALTGLYGFQRGIQRFAFNENGEVLIADGQGNKIELKDGALTIAANFYKINVSEYELNANNIMLSSSKKLFCVYDDAENTIPRVKVGYLENADIYGLGIYNGAIKIYNNKKEEVFGFDSEGKQLQMIGSLTMKNSEGTTIFDLDTITNLVSIQGNIKIQPQKTGIYTASFFETDSYGHEKIGFNLIDESEDKNLFLGKAFDNLDYNNSASQYFSLSSNSSDNNLWVYGFGEVRYLSKLTARTASLGDGPGTGFSTFKRGTEAYLAWGYPRLEIKNNGQIRMNLTASNGTTGDSQEIRIYVYKGDNHNDYWGYFSLGLSYGLYPYFEFTQKGATSGTSCKNW